MGEKIFQSTVEGKREKIKLINMCTSTKFGPFNKLIWKYRIYNLKSSSRDKNLKHLGVTSLLLQQSIYLRKLDKEITFAVQLAKIIHPWHSICSPEITRIMKTLASGWPGIKYDVWICKWSYHLARAFTCKIILKQFHFSWKKQKITLKESGFALLHCQHPLESPS